VRNRICAAFGRLLRSERGIALPMALMVTVVGMGLAAVPIVASINSQGGNQHNQGANEALAAAETGAEFALRAQGILHIAEGDSQLCVSSTSVTSGWCPEEPVSTTTKAVAPGSIGLATYTYQVLPCFGTGKSSAGCAAVASSVGCTEAPVEIVSTGTALVAGVKVKRRVELSGCAGSFSLPPEWEFKREAQRTELKELEEKKHSLEEPGLTLEATRTKKETERTKLEETILKEEAEGKKETESKAGYKEEEVTHEVAPPVFSAGQVAGIESLLMNGGSNVYNGGVGSNGKVTLTGNANACPTVRYGTEYSATNGSNNPPSYCSSRTFVKGTYKYPPVQPPSNIETANSNARLASLDPVTASWMRDNIKWGEANKELSISNGSTLILEGSLPYFLCRLTLSGGSKLLMGKGKSIRIFFQEPTKTKCPGLNGAAQLVVDNGTTIGPDSNQGPGLYFLGSANQKTEPSKIELGGGSEISQFVLYAPRSTIVANNGVNLSGTIIGQTLELAGGANINKAGVFTPPSSTEFVAPEVVTEKVKVPTTETVKTELAKHKEEKRILDEEIIRITHEIEAINKAPIEKITDEIVEKQNELVAWENLANPGSGSAANTSFKKSSFDECSATPPDSGSPASGC